MLTIIILTYNEEIHLKRCLDSACNIASRVIVVDSFSSDNTCNIAMSYGAEIYQRKFINQANQLKWALENCNINTEWVLRLDADEYLTIELNEEITNKLISLDKNITGVVFNLRVYFMGQWIKHGGYYPMKLLRMWRNGSVKISEKMMDERMELLTGDCLEFNFDIIDENLNTLVAWTNKHNNYSTREAVMRLDDKYHFLNAEQQNLHKTNKQFYMKLPLFFRAFFYFCYRYFFKLGFLDGRKGLIWHFLQGFWYQFLVDAKMFQIEYLAKKENKNIKEILKDRFQVDI